MKRTLFVLLAASQLAGAAYPIAKWWWRSIPVAPFNYSYDYTAKEFGVKSLSEFKTGDLNFAPQYMGRTNSLAARWLLR